MSSLKTRAGRITTGVAALAVGAALALPATALAAPAVEPLADRQLAAVENLADNPMTALAADAPYPVKINQPELTANGNSAKTNITMSQPAGQDLCVGPIVGTGILSENLNEGGHVVYPKSDDVPGAIASKQFIAAGYGLALGATGQTKATPVALGAGEFTAMMVCMSLADAANPGASGTSTSVYLRHIKDGLGVGPNNTPSALGSLGS